MVRIPMLVAMSLLALWAGSAAEAREDALAQGPNVFDRGCGDDQGTDRCASEIQRRMRELYGIEDVEALSAQGVTLRRTMIVDGYGSDVVAITFKRAPGRSPTVEILTPRRSGEPALQPLLTVVGQDTWNQVLAASQDFDQQLVRELPERKDPLLSLCLHSWFVVVEAVDAARLDQSVFGQHTSPAEIRRDAEDTCGDGLASRYAFELARMAREQLKECGSLRVENSRNDAALLSLCHRLGGDRMAAGDAYNFLEKLRRATVRELPNVDDLGLEFFAASAEDLVQPFRAALEGGRFVAGIPHATDIDHATVEGQLFFPAGDGSQVADIKLELVRQIREFVILSYNISAKRRSR